MSLPTVVDYTRLRCVGEWDSLPLGLSALDSVAWIRSLKITICDFKTVGCMLELPCPCFAAKCGLQWRHRMYSLLCSGRADHGA